MTAYTIDISFTFPLDANGNVNIHGTPVVQNLTTQRDQVPATDDSITWTVSATNSANLDGLEIERIDFYSNSAKTTSVTPGCLNPGSRGTSDGSYSMTFKNLTVADTTFYYDVIWEDDDLRTEQKFDPILEVKPRIKRTNTGEAGAG